VLSAYVVVNLLALILGQWLLLLGSPVSFELFTIGAIAYCLCLVPLTLTQLPQPAPRPVPPLRLTRLFDAAPVGAVGCLTVGLANGAFWTLAPVYAQSLGFGAQDVAFFMTVFIAGGALVQWPLGRLSDGMDRRWIIATICTIAALCGLVLGAFGWLLVRTPDILFLFVFLLGASMLPLYSLSIAHANDRLDRSEFVHASAGLLLIMAAMSVPGPLLAAFLTALAGPHALFLFTALAHAAMAFFAFTRTRMRQAQPLEGRDSYAPAAQTSPAAATLDPRASEST
jgi:MFS family permease